MHEIIVSYLIGQTFLSIYYITQIYTFSIRNNIVPVTTVYRRMELFASSSCYNKSVFFFPENILEDPFFGPYVLSGGPMQKEG